MPTQSLTEELPPDAIADEVELLRRLNELQARRQHTQAASISEHGVDPTDIPAFLRPTHASLKGVKNLADLEHRAAIEAAALIDPFPSFGEVDLPKGARRVGTDATVLDVGAAIRRIRKAKGLTLAQVAGGAGTDTGNLSRIETNKQGFSQALIDAIARAMGVSTLDIFKEADPDEPSIADTEAAPELRPFKRVPVVGTVEGGPEGYLEEFGHPVGHGEGVIEYPAKGRHAYALRVRGESMHPRIRSGEFILVEPDIPAQAGDDVVVICRDGRKMVKQMLYQRDGEVTLGSINNGFKPVSVPLAEVEAIHFVAGILPRGAFNRG